MRCNSCERPLLCCCRHVLGPTTLTCSTKMTGQAGSALQSKQCQMLLGSTTSLLMAARAVAAPTLVLPIVPLQTFSFDLPLETQVSF